MLVERSGFAGGYITSVSGPGFDGFVDFRSGLPIVGGIVSEFARLVGGATGDISGTSYRASNDIREVRNTPNRTRITINLERFKLHADRLMQQAGVRSLYHTHVADVISQGDRVTGVVISNKSALTVVKPKTVVDATGDADVAAWAGAPFDLDEEMQPMTLHFRVAQVQNITPELRDKCAKVLERAHEEGRLGIFGGPWMGELCPNEILVNATRFSGSGLDPEDLTAAEMKGREDAMLMFELWKEELPEFRSAYFVTSGPVVGVRESRRIRGEGMLTMDDISTHRKQDDVVVKGAWWVDRHPTGKAGYHKHWTVRPYDISYKTLLPQGLANVWVAGRCHSAEIAALSSSRVTVTAMGMGQAAGTAASLAAQRNQDASEIDIHDLQTRLLDDGAIILDRADEILKVGDELADSVPQSISG